MALPQAVGSYSEATLESRRNALDGIATWQAEVAKLDAREAEILNLMLAP